VKKSYIIIIIIMIVAAYGALHVARFYVRRKLAGPGKAPTVRVESAKRGELIEFVVAPGEIEPKTRVEIRPRVSARIIELPYDEGDTVTCGDPNANPPVPPSVLVRLDAKDLESVLVSVEAGRDAQAAQIEVEKARIEGQRASLEGLEASLKQAQRDLERQKGLLESQDISQSTFDQAKLRLDEFKSQYDAAKHTLESAELNIVVLQYNLEAANANVTKAKEALGYTTITSPIDGVVTRLNNKVGEIVIIGIMNNPGTLIMEVADLSQMLVVAQVDESDVGKLQVGQKAKLHVDAFPDKNFTGVVDSIALAHLMSNTMTKYFRTEILLDTADEKLHSGLTAHVEIETLKHTNVLKVPTQAVLGLEVDNLPLEIRENSPEVDPAKTFATVVYCYNDGKAVVTPVKIGQSNLTHTIIESGITEEDKIIVGPYKVLESIKHDQKVRDEREENAKKSTKVKADANDANDSN
jgi:HlyD family secretion protein